MTIIEKIVIEDNSNIIRSLQLQNNHLKEQLTRQEEKIADLTTRLKVSFQADDITKKQELITLKKNIGSAVKLQYIDFCENKDAVCNEDNYAALKNNLEYIFRGLKRCGIEL